MSERTIFKALTGVQSALSAQGISKDQTNNFDKYKFRGIDDVLNAMAPILAKHGVLIIPSVKNYETKQVPTAKGGVQNHTTILVEYTLYDTEGDSVHHMAVGEAMDRGDKSINKAMSAAFKYFLFQAFCIPLQGQDADGESHEIVKVVASTEQWDELIAFMAAKDAFGLRHYLDGFDNDMRDALFNMAPKGQKSRFKQECRDLYQNGVTQVKGTVVALQEAIEAGDGSAIEEIDAEMDTLESDYVDAALSATEKHQYRELLQQHLKG
jgi:hypothetical protein